MNQIFDFQIHLPLELYNVDINVQCSKQVIGIFGASGSGKTSILESIVGLRRQSKGCLKFKSKIWQEDEKGIRLTTEKRNIGYVPQDHLLFPHLNVRKNLEFGKKRFYRNNKDFSRYFHEIVDVLKLQKLLTRKVESLSGGEKQRVSIGRALCSNPELLVFDEPLSSLDIALKERILPFLINIKDRFKIPMIIVSHNPLELQALCDEIIAINKGNIIASGTPSEVFSDPGVYESTTEAGYKNYIRGSIVEQRDHSSVVKIDGSTEQHIHLLKTNKDIGNEAMLAFPANDILISTKPISGISARNQLKATLCKIKSFRHKQIILTQLEGNPTTSVMVELTHSALEELDLQTGSNVYLIIKSSSIELIG